MSILENIQTGRVARPPRIVCYGPHGIGKSTFGSQTPQPVFVQCEDGLDEIDCRRFPLAASYDDVTGALRALKDEEHSFETVVVDSLDWLESLVWDQLCRQHGAASIEQVGGGYGKGYILALKLWREVVGLLDSLRNGRGMVVILLAHSKIERFEDPESAAYDRHAPRLHKHAAALLCEWSDAVLFATRKLRTQTEDAGFNRKRTLAAAVGKGGGERILRCCGGPSCAAKNRYGIVDDLPLSWAALVGAISSSQQQGETHG